MPVIDFSNTSPRSVFLGVVRDVAYKPEHNIYTGRTLVSETLQPLLGRPRPPKILTLLLLIVPVLAFLFATRVRHLKIPATIPQAKQKLLALRHYPKTEEQFLYAAFVGSLGLNVLLHIFFKAGHSINVTRRIPYQEIATIEQSLKIEIQDYSSPPQFDRVSFLIKPYFLIPAMKETEGSRFELRGKTYYLHQRLPVYRDKIKEGHVVGIYATDTEIWGLYSLNSDTYFDTNKGPATLEAGFGENKRNFTRLTAFEDKQSPLWKRPFDFSDAIRSSWRTGAGGILGQGFRPWHSYIIGTVTVIDDRGAVLPHQRNILVCVSEWGKPPINPAVTAKVGLGQARYLQTGHIVAALMLENNLLGSLFDFTTRNTIPVYSSAGFGRHWVLENEPTRFEAEARMVIELIAEYHFEELMKGGGGAGPMPHI